MISLDAMSSLVDTGKNAAAANNASSLQSSLSNISSDSSEEELLQVCKDFESYFVQKIIEESKKTLDNEDSSISTLKDYHMDSVIELVADEVVDEVGTNFTQQLFEQMKRNYNIE